MEPKVMAEEQPTVLQDTQIGDSYRHGSYIYYYKKVNAGYNKTIQDKYTEKGWSAFFDHYQYDTSLGETLSEAPLTSIPTVINGIETQVPVVSYSHIFSNLGYDIKKIDFINFDTAAVVDFRNAFYASAKVQILNIEHLNLANALALDNACDYYDDSFDLPVSFLVNQNFSKVEEFKNYFYKKKIAKDFDCTNLILNPNAKIEGLFRDCQIEANFDFSSLPLASTNILEGLFSFVEFIRPLDSNLVDIPINFTGLKLAGEQGKNLFYYATFNECYIDCKTLDLSKVTNLSRAFGRLSIVKQVDGQEVRDRILEKKFLFNSLNFDSAIDLSYTFMEWQNDLDLSNITFPKAEIIEGMFDSCGDRDENSYESFPAGISSIKFANNPFPIVKNIEGCFYGCVLKELDLSSWDLSKVTEASYFLNSLSIEKINLYPINQNMMLFPDNASMFISGSIGNDVDITRVINTSKMTDFSGFCMVRTTLYQGTTPVSMPYKGKILGLEKLDYSKGRNFSAFFSNYHEEEIIDLNDFNFPIEAEIFTEMFANSNIDKFINLTFEHYHNLTDLSHMFAYVIGNLSIDFNSIDFSHVTSVEGMFEEAHIKTILHLTEQAELYPNLSFSDMFYDTTIDELKVGGSLLTDVNGNSNRFFDGVIVNKLTLLPLSPNAKSEELFSGLTTNELDLGNLNWESLTNFTGAQLCSHIHVDNVYSSKTLSIKNAVGMFYNAFIKNLDLTNFDFSNCESMRNLCSTSYIDKIIFNKNFHLINKIPTDGAFFNSNFKEAVIPSDFLKQSSNITNMFYSMKSNAIVIGEGQTYELKVLNDSGQNLLFGLFSDLQTNALVLNDNITVTDNIELSFYNQYTRKEVGLFTDITADEIIFNGIFSFTNVINETARYLFSEMKGKDQLGVELKNLQNFHLNCSRIDYLFYNGKFRNLKLPTFTKKITSADYAFKNVITDSLDVSSLVFDGTSGRECFYNCTGYDGRQAFFKSPQMGIIYYPDNLFAHSALQKVVLDDTAGIDYLFDEANIGVIDILNYIYDVGINAFNCYDKDNNCSTCCRLTDHYNINVIPKESQNAQYPLDFYYEKMVMPLDIYQDPNKDSIYEYCYQASYIANHWIKADKDSNGWGVRLKDPKKIVDSLPYKSEAVIDNYYKNDQGYISRKEVPVTSCASLFANLKCSFTPTINFSHIRDTRFLYSNIETETLDLQNESFPEVTNASNMFANAKVNNILFSVNDNFPQVRDASKIFYNYKGLNNQNGCLTNFERIKFISVENFESSFEKVFVKQNLLFNGVSSKVKNVENMFKDFSDAEKIDLHNINLKQTPIVTMFENCSAKEVVVTNQPIKEKLEATPHPETLKFTSLNLPFVGDTKIIGPYEYGYKVVYIRKEDGTWGWVDQAEYLKTKFAEELDYNFEGERLERDFSGWSVRVLNRESTAAITENPQDTIDNLPVTSLYRLFQCNANKIELTNYSPSFVIDMASAFSEARTANEESIDPLFPHTSREVILNNCTFNTVTNISRIFEGAHIKKLDFTTTSFPNLTNAKCFVNYAQFEQDIVGLENLNFSKLTKYDYLFTGIKVPHLDLSHISAFTNPQFLNAEEKARNYKFMFWNSQIEILNLSNWKLTKNNDFSFIFDFNYFFLDAKINQIIGLDTWKSEELSNFCSFPQAFEGLTTNSLDLSSWVFNFDQRLSYVEQLPEESRFLYGFYLSSALPIFSRITIDNLISYQMDIKAQKSLLSENWEAPGSAFIESAIKQLDVTNLIQSVSCSLRSMFHFSRIDQIKGLESWDTSGIVDMTYFCDNLITQSILDISSFDCSKAMDLDCAFRFGDFSKDFIRGYENLDFSSVVTAEHLFEGWTTVNVSNLNFSKVTSTKYMFACVQNIIGLENLTFPNLNMGERPYFPRASGMFNGCTSQLTFNKNAFPNLIYGNSMFSYYSGSDHTLDISNLFPRCAVWDHMFSGAKCKKLIVGKSSYLPSQEYPTRSMYQTFAGMISETIDCSQLDLTNTIDVRGLFRNVEVGKILVPKITHSNVPIKASGFLENIKTKQLDLTSIDFSSNLEPDSYNYPFWSDFFGFGSAYSGMPEHILVKTEEDKKQLLSHRGTSGLMVPENQISTVATFSVELVGNWNHKVILTLSEKTTPIDEYTGNTTVSWQAIYDIPNKGHLQQGQGTTVISLNGQEQTLTWYHADINDQRDFVIGSGSFNIKRTSTNSKDYSIPYAIVRSTLLGYEKIPNSKYYRTTMIEGPVTGAFPLSDLNLSNIDNQPPQINDYISNCYISDKYSVNNCFAPNSNLDICWKTIKTVTKEDNITFDIRIGDKTLTKTIPINDLKTTINLGTDIQDVVSLRGQPIIIKYKIIVNNKVSNLSDVKGSNKYFINTLPQINKIELAPSIGWDKALDPYLTIDDTDPSKWSLKTGWKEALAGKIKFFSTPIFEANKKNLTLYYRQYREENTDKFIKIETLDNSIFWNDSTTFEFKVFDGLEFETCTEERPYKRASVALDPSASGIKKLFLLHTGIESTFNGSNYYDSFKFIGNWGREIIDSEINLYTSTIKEDLTSQAPSENLMVFNLSRYEHKINNLTHEITIPDVRRLRMLKNGITEFFQKQGEENTYFKIEITVTQSDGYTNQVNSIVFCPTNNIPEIFYVPPAARIGKVFNNFTYGDLGATLEEPNKGPYSKYFYQKLRFYLDPNYDTNYSRHQKVLFWPENLDMTPEEKIKQRQEINSCEVGIDKYGTYIDTLLNNTTPETKYGFSFLLADRYNYFLSTDIVDNFVPIEHISEKIRVPQFDVKSIGVLNKVLQPYDYNNLQGTELLDNFYEIYWQNPTGELDLNKILERYCIPKTNIECILSFSLSEKESIEGYVTCEKKIIETAINPEDAAQEITIQNFEISTAFRNDKLTARVPVIFFSKFCQDNALNKKPLTGKIGIRMTNVFGLATEDAENISIDYSSIPTLQRKVEPPEDITPPDTIAIKLLEQDTDEIKLDSFLISPQGSKGFEERMKVIDKEPLTIYSFNNNISIGIGVNQATSKETDCTYEETQSILTPLVGKEIPTVITNLISVNRQELTRTEPVPYVYEIIADSLIAEIPALPHYVDIGNVYFLVKDSEDLYRFSFNCSLLEGVNLDVAKYQILGHEKPEIQIIEANFINTKKNPHSVVIKFKINNLGIEQVIKEGSYLDAQQITYFLHSLDGEIIQTQDLPTKEENIYTITFKNVEFLANDNWEKKEIFLELSTSHNYRNKDASTIISKSGKTLTKIIYNIAPTVSYRKEKVGINTNQLQEYTDSIAVIKQRRNHKLIQFVGTDKNDQELIEYIDLASKKIGGFIIQGGTWDSQTGDTFKEGIYEYKYNYRLVEKTNDSIISYEWKEDPSQNGWGVRIREDIEAPLSTSPIAPLLKVKSEPVVNYDYLYAGRTFEKILLSSEEPLITSMIGTFKNAKISTIDLSYLNIDNVINFNQTFAFVTANKILNSIHSSDVVQTAEEMFMGATIQKMDSVDYFGSECEENQTIISLARLFKDSRIPMIDMGAFTPASNKIYNLQEMFAGCRTNNLSLLFVDMEHLDERSNLIDIFSGICGLEGDIATAKNTICLVAPPFDETVGSFSNEAYFSNFVNYRKTKDIDLQPGSNYFRRTSTGSVEAIPPAELDKTEIATYYEKNLKPEKLEFLTLGAEIEPGQQGLPADHLYYYVFGIYVSLTPDLENGGLTPTTKLLGPGWNAIYQGPKEAVSIGENNLPLTSLKGFPITSLSTCFVGANLNEVDFSQYNNPDILVLDGMFFGSKATRITLGDLGGAKPIGLFSAFTGCYNLEYLDVQNLDTSNVKDLGFSFACPPAGFLNQILQFTQIWPSSNMITSEGEMYTKVPYIKGLHTWNTSKVQSMLGMFMGASASLDLSSFSTESLETAAQMFYFCHSPCINITNFDFSRPEINIDTIFGESTPDLVSWATSDVIFTNESDYERFNNEGTLTPQGQAPAFSINPSVKDDQGNYYFRRGSYIYRKEPLDKTWKVSHNAGIASLSEFSNVPAPFIRIYDEFVTDYESLYWNLAPETKGTNFRVPNMHSEHVTDMSDMFWNSKDFGIIYLDNFDTSNVTNMTDMFLDLGPITKIEGLKNLNTEKVTTMTGMFRNSEIKTIDISNFNTLNVTDMFGMFMRTTTDNLIGLEKIKTLNLLDARIMFKDANIKNNLTLSLDFTKAYNNIIGLFANAKIGSIDLTKSIFHNDPEVSITGALGDDNFSLITNLQNSLSATDPVKIYISNNHIENMLLRSMEFDNQLNQTGNCEIVKQVKTDLTEGYEIKDAYYEYHYNQEWDGENWITLPPSSQPGWGVKLQEEIINNLSLEQSIFSPLQNLYYHTDEANNIIPIYIVSLKNTFNKAKNKIVLSGKTVAAEAFDMTHIKSLEGTFANTENIQLILPQDSETKQQYLNLASCTTCKSIFENSKIQNLPLAGIRNSQNINDFERAFFSYYAPFSDLDLSAFVFDDNSNLNQMFFNAIFTKGYAAAQAEADILNNSFRTSLLSNIKFIIKDEQTL